MVNKKRKFGLKKIVLLTSLSVGLGGCSTADILYNHPIDKWLFDNVIPSGVTPYSIKEKQRKENSLDSKYKNVGPNPWKVVRVVNEENQEKREEMGYAQWPSYIKEIDYLQKERGGFPKEGYRVFKFESPNPEYNGRLTESFRVILDKEGFYREIHDKE